MDDTTNRISRIETAWTLLHQAHGAAQSEVAQAQEAILRRYTGAIYRYLLGILRDDNAADEVFQNFALKFLRGDLRKADPDKGRFRDFVKRVLSNLIHDHRRQRGRQPVEIAAESALVAPDAASELAMDNEFLGHWRDSILERAWNELKEHEQNGKQPLYAVLHYRANHPQATSGTIAAELGQQLGRTLTSAGVRQSLHRARELFSRMLLDEVRRSLGKCSDREVEDEVQILGLMPYCQSALKAEPG